MTSNCRWLSFFAVVDQKFCEVTRKMMFVCLIALHCRIRNIGLTIPNNITRKKSQLKPQLPLRRPLLRRNNTI